MSTPAVALRPATSLKRILFATDFSDESRRVLPYVQGLAGRMGAQVFLCHIVTPVPLAASAPEAAPYLYETARKQAEEALSELANSSQLKPFKPATVLASGLIEDELLSIISQNQIDLVLLGTHGRTGMRKLFLGSVAEEICRVASCPLLTVGPQLVYKPQVEFKNILFPTDLSEQSGRVLPYLRAIAQEYGSSITVLHVMPKDLSTNPEAEVLAEPIRRTMMHSMEHVLAPFNPKYVLKFGDTAETVLNFARETRADLIAMGIRDAFIPGIQFRSSIAYKIMAGAQCPVLTYR